MKQKSCKNCHKEFEITVDDFSFYEKIGVPEPTLCSRCRRIHRLVLRIFNQFIVKIVILKKLIRVLYF